MLKQPVRELSLGERMKMELIAAMLHSPDVLFLDEPTIGLDVVAQHNIQQFLKYYQQRRRITILLTSHYMKDVGALCKRVVIIAQGQIKHDGSLSGIIGRFSSHKVITLQLDEQETTEGFERFGQVLEVQPPKVKLRIERAERPRHAGRHPGPTRRLRRGRGRSAAGRSDRGDVFASGRTLAAAGRRPGGVAEQKNMYARAITWWTILRITLEERLVYRGDFALGTLMRFLPIVTQIFLWWAVFDSVGGTQIQQTSPAIGLRTWWPTTCSRWSAGRSPACRAWRPGSRCKSATARSRNS